MSHVSSLADQGVTFENFFLATSWCCPSRATIQTGKYPHNTQVRSNTWPHGGFGQFMLNDISDAIGGAMAAGGYRTGFMGKYLNEYEVGGDDGADGSPPYPPNYVPPGWDTWISGSGYQEFSYDVVDNTGGHPITREVRGKSPSNYYTDHLATEAVEFLDAPSEDPFFLMVAPYAAHSGLRADPEGPAIKFPAAPRDRAASPTRPATWPPPEFEGGDCGPVTCADVPWPDTAYPETFNVLPQDPPRWMPTEVMTPRESERDREFHVQRIQMLQSVDDMVRSITDALAANGQAENTWIVVMSDNGFHLGEHGLRIGKTSAFDHDVKVPLIVYPPGGTTPATVTAPAQSVDIFPTLVDISQQPIPEDVDGVSLLPWLRAEKPASWRQTSLLELTTASKEDLPLPDDPDMMGMERRGIATTYNALRTPDYLFVDYSPLDGTPPRTRQGEFYDLTVDPAMTTNVYGRVALADRAALNESLLDYTSCVGAGCVTAGSTYPVVRPLQPPAPDGRGTAYGSPGW